MSKNVLSDPTVRINNQNYQIVPNTLRVVRGLGESEVKPQSAGDGNVEMVHSENVETKIGKITFSVYTTDDQINALKTLKGNKNQNYVSISDANSSTILIMKNAALVNDPEIGYSNDGQIELEFHGEQVQ